MKTLIMLALLGTVLAIAGCTEPGHYPVSNQECGSEDPVKDMDVNDCGSPLV